MTRRTLQVDVTELAETMDFMVADGMSSFLDLRTGAILGGDEHEGAHEDESLLPIPPFDGPYKYDRMLRFAATLDRELGGLMEVALQGKGAFRRFQNLVHQHGIADEWYGFQLELDRAEAMRWLDGEDLSVIDVSKRLPPPRPEAAATTVGLADLLVLGAPGGKTELVRGQVRREVRARSPDHSRELYQRLAREISAAAGAATDPTGDADALDAGRFHLRRTDDAVTLLVDVPRELWDRFAADQP